MQRSEAITRIFPIDPVSNQVCLLLRLILSDSNESFSAFSRVIEGTLMQQSLAVRIENVEYAQV